MDEKRKSFANTLHLCCLELLDEFEKVKDSDLFQPYYKTCKSFLDTSSEYFSLVGKSEDSKMNEVTFFHDAISKLISARSYLYYYNFENDEDQKSYWTKKYWDMVDELEEKIKIIKDELRKNETDI